MGSAAVMVGVEETQARLEYEAMEALESLAELEVSFERMRRLARAIRVELEWVANGGHDHGEGCVRKHTDALTVEQLRGVLRLVGDESQRGR